VLVYHGASSGKAADEDVDAPRAGSEWHAVGREVGYAGGWRHFETTGLTNNTLSYLWRKALRILRNVSERARPQNYLKIGVQSIKCTLNWNRGGWTPGWYKIMCTVSL